MANSEIIDFPLLTALTGAQLYGVKNDTDYRIKVGEANGLATLDATGKLPAGQAPATLWGTITGTLSNQLDLQAALNGKQAAGSYAAAVHTHVVGDVTGLQAALDGKQPAGSYAAASHTHDTSHVITGVFAAPRLGVGTANSSTWLRGDGVWSTLPAAATPTWGGIVGVLSNQTDLQNALNAKSDVGHIHDDRYYTEAEVNSLLSGKANTAHSHVIGDVSGLQAALDGKQAAGSYAAAVHTHVATDISNSTATGRSVLTAVDADAARDAIGVYVQATDPGAVADGSLWIW